MPRHTLYFTAPFQIDVRSDPVPQPNGDQLLIKTTVSAISPGTEMLVYRGQLPSGMAVDDTIESLAGTFTYPLTYGYATVGHVIAVGKNLPATWQDRAVFAFQPHCSHFLAEPHQLLPLPNDMSPETAVLLPNMETAVSFLMDGQPIIGERVLVLGQGIVGLLTTALLASYPLADLTAVDHHPLRRRWSTQLGATQSIIPDDVDALNPVDLAYELSGNPKALNQAIEAVGFNGRIVVGSWYGQKTAPLHLGGHFHRNHIRLISSQVSQLAPQWRGRWHKERRMQVAWQMLAQHQPSRLITHRFPLHQAAQAYQILDKQPEQAIQILLTYA